MIVACGYASARRIVEDPCPQPMSATVVPSTPSLAATPSSEGIQASTRLPWYPGLNSFSVPWKRSWSCSCQPRPPTRPEGVADALLVLPDGGGDRLGPDQEGRRGLVSEHRHLLLGEGELACRRVVLRVAAHELRAQPLLDQALVVADRLGQCGAGDRTPVSQGLVQPELVADDHGGGVHGRPEVGHELSDEVVELVFVDRHCVISVCRGLDGGHRGPGGLQRPCDADARPLQALTPRMSS